MVNISVMRSDPPFARTKSTGRIGIVGRGAARVEPAGAEESGVVYRAVRGRVSLSYKLHDQVINTL